MSGLDWTVCTAPSGNEMRFMHCDRWMEGVLGRCLLASFHSFLLIFHSRPPSRWAMGCEQCSD